jgi:AraC family transcriptional regulator
MWERKENGNERPLIFYPKKNSPALWFVKHLHNMQPRFEIFPETKLIGQRQPMSFINNKTFELWNGFMPRRKEIKNVKGTELYSIEEYPANFFDAFDPNTEFIKWAAVAVSEFREMPENMETLIIPEGLYAVFLHKGPQSRGAETYGTIFRTWLPQSGYLIDNRPHFAVMGEKYKREEEDSEEEIWIPVRKE